MIRTLACASVLLAVSTALAAQNKPGPPATIPTPPQLDGNAGQGCTLRVQVRTADERSIPGIVIVQLFRTDGTAVATSNLVDGEPAEFQVPSGKDYSLAVSGNGIQSSSSYIHINLLESAHVEIVHVKPDLSNVPGQTPAGPVSVSVSELMIPPKAAEEMRKGQAEYAKDNWDKAAEHFQKAADLYPQYARAFDLLGVVAMRKSNRTLARQMFAKSMQVDSTFYPAYVDLARMDFQDKRYSDSVPLLNKAVGMNPGMPDATALLAAAEFATGDYQDALAAVDRTHALHDHEQFAEVHLMAARLLARQSQPQAAIAQYELFLKEKPQSPEADSARKALATLESTSRR